MKISVVGTGYVGLVSGVCLAEKGHDVICVDIDEKKVDMINQGIPPIHEKGLDTLLKKNNKSRFGATSDLKDAILNSDITLIAVGTPYKGDEIDLSYIKEAAEQIGEILAVKSTYHVVVVKSTVVPGTTEEIVLPIIEKSSGKRAGADFGVGMNPEFLREGEAVDDFMYPDRIVIGGIDNKTLDILEQMYAVFPSADLIKTTPKTAEMIKYTANSLLATLISFSNEIGNLCSAIGDIDVVDVMRGVHLDKRLTPVQPDGLRVIPGITSYLEAGCGFGGSCFPKDVRALIAHARKFQSPLQILSSVMEVNESQPSRVVQILKKYLPSVKDKKIAILGLAFKPGTDDMRESPAIPIIRQLHAEGAIIYAYDPVAVNEAKKVFGDNSITYSDTMDQTIENVEAILILNRCQEFLELPALMSKNTLQPVVIDGRRFIEKNTVPRYDGIGL